MQRISSSNLRKSARQAAIDLIEEIEFEQSSWIAGAETTIEVFQKLVDTCDVWDMQQHYGVMASALIDAGLVRTN